MREPRKRKCEDLIQAEEKTSLLSLLLRPTIHGLPGSREVSVSSLWAARSASALASFQTAVASEEQSAQRLERAAEVSSGGEVKGG